MSPVNEADLHAYADGQLDPARRAEVEAYLAAHPEAGERVAGWRRQTDELHAAFDGVLNESVPLAALPLGLRGSSRDAARRPAGWGMALAVSVASLAVGGAVGGAIGWIAHDHADTLAAGAPSMERFAREALASHVVYAPEVRHPVEVAAADEAHLVAWLSKRLGAPLRVPDLRAQGFHLIGGRLGVAEGGPSAILMYEADDGTRLSLQLRHMARDTPDTGFRLERMGPGPGERPAAAARTMAFYWVDRDLGFALAGPLERAPLLALAEAVYRQYQGG
ncbi:Transmembrane regulator protein PrtR [Cupriavidus basilensis]|uniref:Transmembrane regulator protein PrtR n=2 Tax=Cupriavidus basilensis TaxID=68895 RepID=A0A0C4YKS2_9BURK|nr:Transmembrane regulator protein PrtR [Cupriavidus basilensis]